MNCENKVIVLIHGLWLTPRSWDRVHCYYESLGHHVLAPAWPRLNGAVDEIRRDPSALSGLGLQEITDYYQKIVQSLDEPPIIIGHSMGGLITQMLLDRRLGAAGVSIAGTAPKGVFRVPLAVLRLAGPILSNPFNYWRCKMLTFEKFRYVFANVMTETLARAVYDQDVIPGPCRPIFEAAVANFTPGTVARVNHRNNRRSPLLLIAGANDNFVPAILNRTNFKLYRRSTAETDYKEFPERSHLIISQEGWKEVADYALSWAMALRR